MVGRLKGWTYQRLHGLSLTHRLVAVVVLLVLAAYVLTTSVSLMMLRGYLVDRADADLGAYIEPLAQRTYSQIVEEATGEQVGLEQQTFVPPNPYVVVFTPADPDGPAQTRVFQPRRLEVSMPALDRVDVNDARLGEHFTVQGEDGVGSWRVLAAQLTDGQGRTGGTIAVALPLTSVESTVRQLAWLTAVIGLTTLVLVGVLAGLLGLWLDRWIDAVTWRQVLLLLAAVPVFVWLGWARWRDGGWHVRPDTLLLRWRGVSRQTLITTHRRIQRRGE